MPNSLWIRSEEALSDEPASAGASFFLNNTFQNKARVLVLATVKTS